jgi:hypothetical protein
VLASFVHCELRGNRNIPASRAPIAVISAQTGGHWNSKGNVIGATKSISRIGNSGDDSHSESFQLRQAMIADGS